MENILDYCTISGESVKKYEGTKRYVATGDVIENKIINFSEVDYMNKPSRANQIAKVGDLLFAKMKETKKVIKIDEENSKNIYSTGFCVIRPNEGILTDYIYWVLNSPKFNRDKDRNCKGATQKALNNDGLKKIKINKIPDIVEQQKIVSKLNKINKIITKKKKQLNILDELVKSQFVEMFGEPLISNNYGRITLDKLIRVSQGLQIPIEKRKNEKGNNSYKYITIQYLNGSKKEEYIENPNERVICSKDDVLMTRTGNTGQVITNVEGVFHNNFFKMDYDRKRINKEFLIKYFENESVYKDIIRRATTSTIPDLSHSQFYKMSIDLPPINLQNQFSEIVKQIDKQKFEIEKSLKETQELYKSLMEKYFG